MVFLQATGAFPDAAGFAVAFLIGFTLGLFGGGGAILAVPALVYLEGVEPVLATSYSLFVVGGSAALGASSYVRRGMINYCAALLLAAPGFFVVFATRKFLLPAIPETLLVLNEGAFILSRGMAIMTLFALVMIASSLSMIRGRRGGEESEDPDVDPAACGLLAPRGQGDEAIARKGPAGFRAGWILAAGAFVGLITGLAGAGGGFLLVPALVLFAGLPVRYAVGASLLIIATNSLLGFLGDLNEQPIQWSFLLSFAALSGVGILAGTQAAKQLPAVRLKQGFGFFVLVMGAAIFARELFL